MLTVISGPPCSGKSTYARQHYQPGDIIIDFDRIAQAFGSPVVCGHDAQYRKVTLEARDAAITAAVDLHHAGTRVWLVDSQAPSRPGVSSTPGGCPVRGPGGTTLVSCTRGPQWMGGQHSWHHA